jgi:hypothetical protein
MLEKQIGYTDFLERFGWRQSFNGWHVLLPRIKTTLGKGSLELTLIMVAMDIIVK